MNKLFVVALCMLLPLAVPAWSQQSAPKLVDETVEEWLDFAMAPPFEVPGAIVYISTPYWEGTWTRGTADLQSQRPISTSDTFRIASISKTFTATVILQLIDEGFFKLDDKLAQFGDGGFGVPAADKITIRQLLNHTSGIADWFDSTEALSDLCSCQPSDASLLGYSPREMVDMAITMGPLFPPGEDWSYSDTNYILLGMIVEWVTHSEVTGTYLGDEIKERIFNPLGMVSSRYPSGSSMPGTSIHAYWIPEDICGNWSEYTVRIDGTDYNPSKEFGCGAIISTLEDLKIWSHALAHGTLLSESSHRAQMAWSPYPSHGGRYGLGIMYLAGGVGHGGDLYVGYSSGMYYIPSRQVGVIIMMNSETINATYLYALLVEALFPERAPVTASDYSGKGRSEISVFRRSSGLWAARGLGRIYFGGEHDLPVSGDYDGDGYTDVAVFRPLTGLWAIKGVTRLYFGGINDTPVPGDYDGDGSCDIAVFKDIEGRWSVREITRFYFGDQFDRSLPVDYIGNGTVQAAIFRPSSVFNPNVGLWAIRGHTRFYFGSGGDLPVPGVYRWYGSRGKSGPFRSQSAVFRPSTGLWAVQGGARAYFGQSGDIPQPGDFDGNQLDNIALYRLSTGFWAVRGITRAYFGGRPDIETRFLHGIAGDIPVTR